MRLHKRNKQIHFATFFNRHRELTSSKEEIIVYQFRKTSWIFFLAEDQKKKNAERGENPQTATKPKPKNQAKRVTKILMPLISQTRSLVNIVISKSRVRESKRCPVINIRETRINPIPLAMSRKIKESLGDLRVDLQFRV